MVKNSEIEFRALRPDDGEAAADVIYRSASTAYDRSVWDHSRESVRRWFARTQPDWTDVRLAVQDGRVVGVLCLQGDFIDQLFVDPAHQRRGLGSKLLQQAIDGSSGELTLRVFENNLSARAFYERHGFAAVEQGRSDDEGEPDLLYRRPAGGNR